VAHLFLLAGGAGEPAFLPFFTLVFGDIGFFFPPSRRMALSLISFFQGS